tara:strand:- start:4746 stop:5414 length:669 start_codon:yes stop_codon:yes gene_type:complete
MQQKISKKILLYFFIFIVLTTFNNQSFKKLKYPNIDMIKVTGLSEIDNFRISNDLEFLKSYNIFFIDKKKIREVIFSNNLVEDFYTFKKYPKTLDFKVIKAKFLGKVKKEDQMYYLGSNGKLIKAKKEIQNIPYIYGNFEFDEFLNFKRDVDNSNFDYELIKSLFFLKNKRWNIETHTGIKIKLPMKLSKKKFDQIVLIMQENYFEKINVIDLRQNNQVILK